MVFLFKGVRALAWEIIALICVVALIVLVFFLLPWIGTISNALGFSGSCGQAIFMKTITTEVFPLRILGFMFSVRIRDSCNPKSTEVKFQDEAEFGKQLYYHIRQCFSTFGGGRVNWLHDEGAYLHPCFFLYYNSSSASSFKIVEILRHINQSFFTEINSSKLSTILIKPGPDGNAQFYDVVNENFSSSGLIEIYYLDWKTFAEMNMIVGDIKLPCLTDQALCCVANETLRKSEIGKYHQNASPLNAYVEENELYVWLLKLPTICGLTWGFYPEPSPIKDLFFRCPKKSLVDIQLLKWCSLTWPCEYAPQKVNEACKYHRTGCGYLTRAMACCNDKIVVCVR